MHRTLKWSTRSAPCERNSVEDVAQLYSRIIKKKKKKGKTIKTKTAMSPCSTRLLEFFFFNFTSLFCTQFKFHLYNHSTVVTVKTNNKILNETIGLLCWCAKWKKKSVYARATKILRIFFCFFLSHLCCSWCVASKSRSWIMKWDILDVEIKWACNCNLQR